MNKNKSHKKIDEFTIKDSIDYDPEYIAFEHRKVNPYDYCLKHDGFMSSPTWERYGVIEMCPCCKEEERKKMLDK